MMWKILCILLFLKTISTIYTSGEASRCLEEKIATTCSDLVQACITHEGCQSQLSMYQHCQFGGEESVFNGYCFMDWSRKAVITRQLIQCFVVNCDFHYNSVLGITEMLSCSDRVIAESEDCDEECLKILETQQTKMAGQEMNVVMEQKLENKSAVKIWNKIYEECWLRAMAETKEQNLAQDL